MKIYILTQTAQTPDNSTPFFSIIGVYKNKCDAMKKQAEEIKDNLENFGFVEDENKSPIFENSTIIFWNYQENWNNYIEFSIEQKEIK